MTDVAFAYHHPETRTPELADDHAFRTLGARFRGQFLRPGGDDYDTARRVWNGSIDRRPALIARCMGVADVRAALDLARAQQLLVSVRGGGHNVTGNAVCDGGVVVDLSAMKGVQVDPARRTAQVEAGVLWGELDRETQAVGLATTGGVMSTTGVAGFTLGGGIGWLMRRYGLACDNLLSAGVVTADGQYLTASATENMDLFWGIRGGGGNFGIVTSFEFQLHQVGPTVLAGLRFYPLEQAPRLLRVHRDFVATAPNDLTTIAILRKAPAAPFLPPEVRGTPVLIIALCYAGPVEEGQRVIRPLDALGQPLVDLIGPMPYLDMQRFGDGSWAPGYQNYWKSHYLVGLSDGAIDTLVAHAERISSPLSDMKIAHMQGAVSRVDEDATAFGHRAAPFNLNVNTRWSDPSEADQHIAWTHGLFEAMKPYSTGGVYVNFLGDEGEDRVKAAYSAAQFQGLTALKNTYDPTNVFRLNQNIKPTV